MAHHLAKIHGTEEDKVNCPFYYKIGACRHGDRCSRIHHKPAFSQTLLVKHLYQNPRLHAQIQQQGSRSPENNGPDQHQALEDYLCFYEDLYLEFSKLGRVSEMHVVDNLSDHMIGNVYVKMSDEETAADALSVMNGRYYDGRIVQLEFSPVTDFREARCRAHEEGECDRGSVSCNFLHIKPIPESLVRSLEDEAEDERREERRRRHHHKKDKKRRREHKSASSSKRHRSSSSSRRDRREEDDRSRSSDGSSDSGSD